MATAERNSIGYMLTQLALGLYFFVTGIWTLQGGNGNEIAAAVKSVTNGDTARIICLVFGIIEVLAGLFLLLRIFVTFSSPIDTILMIIIMIAWIVAIVLLDFIGKGALPSGSIDSVLRWLSTLSRHLLVLGGIVIVKN